MPKPSYQRGATDERITVKAPGRRRIRGGLAGLFCLVLLVLGATSCDDGDPAQARLSIVASIDFGEAEKTVAVTLYNEGNAAADWTATAAACSWIVAIAPASGRLEGGRPQSIQVRIDRTGMPIGSYQCDIKFAAEGTTARSTVELTVGTPCPEVRFLNALRWNDIGGFCAELHAWAESDGKLYANTFDWQSTTETASAYQRLAALYTDHCMAKLFNLSAFLNRGGCNATQGSGEDFAGELLLERGKRYTLVLTLSGSSPALALVDDGTGSRLKVVAANPRPRADQAWPNSLIARES
ncbi:MAG: hypothetical protein HYV63_18655 [Candidatus Schekmanbacteria bacterium]|nr:hypothetical protein [Candidatus Schekmanbacteria bacterium]